MSGRRVVWYGLTGLSFTAVVVVLMMWLIGTFHPKVDRKDQARVPPTEAVALRPAGDVRTATVERIEVPRVETAVGTIRAVHETQVAAKLLAKVVEVRVKAGQRVRRGEVLVRLDDADLKARLQQAQAAADAARARRDQAQIEYDRVVRLFEQDSAARIELDRVRNALKAAEADLERAEQAVREAETVLAYATIRSPIDGVVVEKHVEAGDTVTPGQAVVTLYDPSRMQLVARVREALTRRLRVGQTIRVRIESLGKTCEGTVSEIVPEAETASRTFSVKVTGPCPPDVYTGMFGRLLIPVDRERVLVIPRAALRRVGQLHLVDVVEDGRLLRRAVQPGRTFGEKVEILSGLRPGERVALPDRDGTAAG